VGTTITLPETDSDRSYDLDGLGNWRRTAYTTVGEEKTTEVRDSSGDTHLNSF